jgi:hypothetical protein
MARQAEHSPISYTFPVHIIAQFKLRGHSSQPVDLLHSLNVCAYSKRQPCRLFGIISVPESEFMDATNERMLCRPAVFFEWTPD